MAQPRQNSAGEGSLKPHPKVLVIDSDPAVGRMLRIVLETGRCRMLWARSLAEGLAETVEKRPDAIVLELDLPDSDGFEAIGALREWSSVPVLMLSGRASIAERIRALDAGANDFVTKPFAPEELAARLRVLLRSEPPESDGPLLVSGALRIDMATREMTANGFPLGLTATEEAVLYILARHAGKVVPHERIIRAVWGVSSPGKIHDLQVHVARLRRKLGDRGAHKIIRGEGGVGYSLALSAEHEYATLKTVV
jgi:two-component system, OmpR family, KDP operon response regulator KdpE